MFLAVVKRAPGYVKLLVEPVYGDNVVARGAELPDMPPLPAPEVENAGLARDSSAGGHGGLPHQGHALVSSRL
jgi:hypothetical protein